MTGAEAALWATGMKMVMDMVSLGVGRKITIADLDAAIAAEEVRSKMLEEERRKV